MTKEKESVDAMVQVVNKSSAAKNAIDKWISTYNGKIIEFHLGDEKFYVVFTREGTRIEDGEYPSPDATIVTNSEVFLNFIASPLNLKSMLKSGEIEVWGNLHEFIALLQQVILSDPDILNAMQEAAK
ncbi:MAG: SCP2 sterol-binding domain-containing protein [Candidatus Lokiarchaeia archaeon]